MKHLVIWLFMPILACPALAQTKISKTYPIKSGEKLELHFDYPKLIRVSTWDKDTVAVDASVDINSGQLNDVFSLEEEHVAGVLRIRNDINMGAIPEVYYVEENGEKKRFDLGIWHGGARQF
ncbi:hypothetical protein [Parapedobacter tibetensis]|uniref:hypothetical protein n=1 Tax=Parapedobacter tibetensis TaxID=2972951 RepID=UPI00214DA487|nr:hypothetical protein [Parapedobacter tibetensis]